MRKTYHSPHPIWGHCGGLLWCWGKPLLGHRWLLVWMGRDFQDCSRHTELKKQGPIAYLRECFGRFGVLEELLSDWRLEFTSKETQSFFHRWEGQTQKIISILPSIQLMGRIMETESRYGKTKSQKLQIRNNQLNQHKNHRIWCSHWPGRYHAPSTPTRITWRQDLLKKSSIQGDLIAGDRHQQSPLVCGPTIKTFY